MAPELYSTVYIIVVSLLCLGVGVRYVLSDGYELQEQKGNLLWSILLASVLAIWLGLRPISPEFVDMGNYAYNYNNYVSPKYIINWHEEWIWQFIIVLCRTFKLSVNEYFLVIEAIYIFTSFWAVKRFMPLSPLTALLFVWITMSFYSYGTNTIRNGVACSTLLLAFSLLLERRTVIWGILIGLVAFGVHRTVLLPILGFCGGLIFSRKPIVAFYIWIGALVISFFETESIIKFLQSLNFDDRFVNYTMNDRDFSIFSRSGYRWDFLLYGLPPILCSFYFIEIKKESDTWYNILSCTYILSNAAWVILNQVSFSDRFAYLSWFLYPVIIAYPFLNLPLWDDQDRKIGYCLIVYMLLNLAIFLYARY